MKSEKGISLISLIIYLIAFTTAVAIVANVSNYFYKNLTQSGNSLKTNEQFLKLNSVFEKVSSFFNIGKHNCKTKADHLLSDSRKNHKENRIL